MKSKSLIQRLIDNRAVFLGLILLVLVIIMILTTTHVFSGGGAKALFTQGFMTAGNLRGIFLNLIVQGIMLSGLSMLLICGEIDLSTSAQATIAAMLFAQICMSFPNLPWPFALLICMLVGVCIGCLNAFFVNVMKFPSFIATIGMTSVYAGLAKVWTNSDNIQIARDSFNAIGKYAFFGRFPLLFLFSVIILIAYGLMLSNTKFGRSVYMVGGNRVAARLAGLNPAAVRTKVFINNSVLAVVAGVCWASQMKLASPTAMVSSMPDLSAITAAVLGGVSFMGGQGKIAGAFFGMALLNVFNNILTVINVPTYWNVSAQGALLIIALILDYANAERSKKKLLEETQRANWFKGTTPEV